MGNKPEQNLQKVLCQWIRIQYPDVYFMSDASGLPIKSWGLRLLLKTTRSNHAAMDIVILEPKGKWHGLVIELKKSSPFKKDGSLLSGEHIRDQQKTIDHLNRVGYYAQFVWDFEVGKELIETYLTFRKR